MATKTISIDLEAYERLKSVQNEHESFSQVIKRVVRPKFDVEAWMDEVARLGKGLSKEFFDAVDEQIQSRRHPREMKSFEDPNANARHKRSARSNGKKRKSKKAGDR